MWNIWGFRAQVIFGSGNMASCRGSVIMSELPFNYHVISASASEQKKKKKIEKKEGLKFLRLLHRPGHSHSLMALRRKTWRSDIQHKEVEVMYEGM